METFIIPIAIVIFIFISGIRVIRPTSRGLIERLGKYNRFANLGFNWIIPLIENVYIVNITEQLVNAETQEIITNDNLNAKVDAQGARLDARIDSVESRIDGVETRIDGVRIELGQLNRSVGELVGTAHTHESAVPGPAR